MRRGDLLKRFETEVLHDGKFILACNERGERAAALSLSDNRNAPGDPGGKMVMQISKKILCDSLFALLLEIYFYDQIRLFQHALLIYIF